MCNRKTKSPTSVLFLFASCFTWFVLAGEAHSASHEVPCPEFTKEAAEALRQTPIYTSNPNCDTEEEYFFDTPPPPYHQHFHVSNPTLIEGKWRWAYYESAASVFIRLSEQIGALMISDPDRFDSVKAQVDALIARIDADVYINSLDNGELNEILSGLNAIRDLSQGNEGFISAQKSAEDAAMLLRSLTMNKCQPARLNNSSKGKRDYCEGEIAFTLLAGCQINYNAGKPRNRRGIVWIDDIPHRDTNYVGGDRLRCWIPDDYQLMGRIFTKQERRYLCRRHEREMKKPPFGDSCP